MYGGKENILDPSRAVGHRVGLNSDNKESKMPCAPSLERFIEARHE